MKTARLPAPHIWSGASPHEPSDTYDCLVIPVRTKRDARELIAFTKKFRRDQEIHHRERQLFARVFPTTP